MATKKDMYTRGEKRSVEKLDLAKKPVGFSYRGKWLGTAKGQPFYDKKTGEERTLTFANWEYLEGEGTGRFQHIADAGFLSAITDGMVQANDVVEIVKMGKKPIGDGKREMNTYEVYSLAPNMGA